MTGSPYSAFVEEAFIDPIRSVLIVDDDYPTFDELLNGEIEKAKGQNPPRDKDWYKDPARIKRVIDKFRDPARPLLVDIHDGTNVPQGTESSLAAHLHQSDLLVLDYQLDKEKPGDGTRAIEIIRKLMESNHFNLVVVHTSEDLEVVFRDTLIGLLSPCDVRLSTEESNKARALVQAGEDAVEGISGRLVNSIGDDQYLYARKHPAKYVRAMSKADQPYSAFKAECDIMKWCSEDVKLVFSFLLQSHDTKLSQRFKKGDPAALTWESGATKFIKCDSVFIAFAAKKSDSDLLLDLSAALNAWKPRPSRLFLAKLRAEMDDYGVIAQSSALENRYALAHWYRRLLNADESSLKWLIAESVARHSEQLLAAILPRVESFAAKLIASEATRGDANHLSKEHFDVDFSKQTESDKAEFEHNAFVCSKPPEGWHLTTGHIFSVGDDYWVCVSPACDMVPGQLSPGRIDTFGNRLPFIAVKLHPVSNGKRHADVQTNRYIFLNFGGSIKIFCFNNPDKNGNASPNWAVLYAEEKGVLGSGFSLGVYITEQEDSVLINKKYHAKIVAQLRYEYALNCVQKLGVNFTRVGLDFV